MLFYFRSARGKWSEFISLGTRAVICWPHAKSKYTYLVLQIQWVWERRNSVLWTWGLHDQRSLQVITSCFVRDNVCLLSVNRSSLFGTWALNNDFMLSPPFVLKFMSCTHHSYFIYIFSLLREWVASVWLSDFLSLCAWCILVYLYCMTKKNFSFIWKLSLVFLHKSDDFL